MTDSLVQSVVTVALAIVGVAVLAVLVSSRSQTPAVIGTLGGAFAQSLTAAEGPVLGAVEAPGMNSYY